MRVITHQERRLAVHFTEADIREGLSFFSEDADFLQVGAWRYPAGKQLANHNHNRVPRQVDRTQECVLVLRGALRARLYDEQDRPVTEVRVGPHEGLLLLAGGHGYEILEDDTLVIECKNGPYPGAEADRRRFG